MNRCSSCNLELVIQRSWIETRHDDTPDEQTEVVQMFEKTCRNPQCENFGKVVSTDEIIIYPAPTPN